MGICCSNDDEFRPVNDFYQNTPVNTGLLKRDEEDQFENQPNTLSFG